MEILKIIAVFVSLVFICLMVVLWISITEANNTQTQCTSKFGAEWHARNGGYSPNFCVNDEGEVRYP